MITLPDFPEQLVTTPKGQMIAVGFFHSHSMASRLNPSQFHPKLVVICESVEYREDGSTKGLEFHMFDADEISPI
jgi:hypothetical protein